MPDFLPDRLEAGTQNVHGAAGLLEGLRFVARQGTGPILRHERRVIRRLAERLGDRSGVRAFYGGDQSGGVLSVILDGEAPEVTADRLAERGIAVRAGHHCAAAGPHYRRNRPDPVRYGLPPRPSTPFRRRTRRLTPCWKRKIYDFVKNCGQNLLLFSGD